MSGVEVLGVVVPARDEEELLPAALAALGIAARAPELAGTVVRLVVVADGCTDRTAAIARAAGATVLEDTGVRGNVGAARHRGMLHLLAEAGRDRFSADRVWLASTDADSRVPPEWLAVQRTAADSGVDALVGTVVLDDGTGLPPGVARAFTAAYDAWQTGGAEAVHPHVHGANLGVRGSAYVAVGGFPPLSVGEDHALVDLLVRTGAGVLRSPVSPVATSSRQAARSRGGLGTDVARLVAQLAAD